MAVIMKWSKQSLALLVSSSLVLASAQGWCADQADQPMAQPMGQAAPPPSEATAETAPQSPETLDQIVAPIALYPDALVGQILAASTYPTEVAEADQWIQQHSGLKGEELAQAVDQQSWDPSVKALTQFPSVLANMDKNLSWTSALGHAYANQPQDVLNAVQVMRERAEQAGNLKSTSQETVTTEGQTIVIQPANPQVVYVPEYDPWLIYGGPVEVYPGWVPFPGSFAAGPSLSFGLGIGIGIFAGFGWGWHHWGADWHGRRVVYNHEAYRGHAALAHAGGFHGGHAASAHAGGFHGGTLHGSPGIHPSAFGGSNHGGAVRASSSHGGVRFGGGSHGGFHGGGFHGGGSHGGGHR
jgi:uncharacterized membrane protein YgcG